MTIQKKNAEWKCRMVKALINEGANGLWSDDEAALIELWLAVGYKPKMAAKKLIQHRKEVPTEPVAA